jgi:hypothetical protein
MKVSAKKVSILSGLVATLACISYGYASTPNKADLDSSDAGEARVQKTGTPDLDKDLSRLNSLESNYAEGTAQRARLKNSTAAVVRKLQAKKRRVVSEE